MTQVPASLTDFARRLLLHEAGDRRSASDLVGAIERGCLGLQGQLAPLLSSTGFDALVGRAIKLAARDFTFLAAVTTMTPRSCSLDGLRQAVEPREPQEVEAALVAILATFIWLLIIFIGENLGLRKVREVWPDVPFTPPGSSSTKAQP
jgi:hypothetical protein